MKFATTLCITTSMLVASVGVAAPVTAPPAATTDPANVLTGTIDAVTVYRGQALVTRVIDVPGSTGLREVVVTDLPEAILPGSLYAESTDGVEIRSVSYRIRPVGEDARESVRAAEKAVRDAKDALDAAKARAAYLDWQKTYLDKLENFVAPTAQAELKGGVLNAETLTKLTDLVTGKRKAQSEDVQKSNLELRMLAETVVLKERELGVLTANTSRTAREAVVFLNATKPTPKVRLSYLVNGANWSPSYNLRIADAKAEKAKLEYQASVQQMSGEDWPGVSLTLSTATPALVATGPSLQPLTVALAAPGGPQGAIYAALANKSYEEAKKAIVQEQRDVERNRNLTGNDAQWAANGLAVPAQPAAGRPMSSGGQSVFQFQAATAADADGHFNTRTTDDFVLSLDTGLNEVADKSQLLDLISNAKVERKSKPEHLAVRQGDEGVSVTYKVAGRTSMPSRADQQLIQIAQMDLPAQVVRAATPTLTQFVYNEAHLTNTSDFVLLAGPTASYIGGEFVGSGGVGTVAAGEGFRAGFGIDSSLRATKELVERTETTQGGNRIIEFTYKLTIANFGKAAAPVRLMDRLPSPKGKEIKLAVGEQKPALSDEKEYRDTDFKKNILRWDLTVPPGATGTSAMAVEYKFTLEYDKQMSLAEGK